MAKKPKKKRKLSAYNRHMSREMKKGRTFKQAVASWKGGSKKKTLWRVTKRSTRRRKVRKTTTTRRSNRVGRKGGFNTQKVFKLVRLAALAMPAAVSIMSATSGEEKAKQIIHKYTGVNPTDGTFRFSKAMEGWLPYLAACGITYGIPKITGILRSF